MDFAYRLFFAIKIPKESVEHVIIDFVGVLYKYTFSIYVYGNVISVRILVVLAEIYALSFAM